MQLDIHSHILPGIDDGSRDLETSIAMLDAAVKAGVKQIIATPHARHSFNLPAAAAAYQQLAPHAKARGVELLGGFEVHFSMLLKLTPEQLRSCRLAGTSALLIEFSTEILPPDWQFTISDLTQAGYRVIIAHPERYRFVQQNLALLSEMRSYGALFQLSANCLEAPLFSPARKAALKMLKDGTISFIASDAHNVSGYERLEKLEKKYASVWPQGGMDKLLNGG